MEDASWEGGVRSGETVPLQAGVVRDGFLEEVLPESEEECLDGQMEGTVVWSGRDKCPPALMRMLRGDRQEWAPLPASQSGLGEHPHPTEAGPHGLVLWGLCLDSLLGETLRIQLLKCLGDFDEDPWNSPKAVAVPAIKQADTLPAAGNVVST